MKILINGQFLEVEGKKTILEVARENNIFIPSLCDHPYLEPFSGCRLCIVEIKGRRGFPPSCGTYVEEGMEIKTETPQLQKMRRQILELILSEHPHACLICNEKENCDEYKSTIRKVGEVTGCVLCPNNSRCDLQDVVQALRIDRVNFPALYRNYEVKREDPFFDRNYNLCILCGRCVRVCHELRGASALSFVFRGSRAVVGTVLDRPLLESGCQFCGACVDICPTGALTERAIKYELLPDESVSTICSLCPLGCEMEIDLIKGKILNSKPLAEGKVNQGQACVKGRFIIRELAYSPKRILKPLIRKKKKLEEVSWDEALDFVAQKLKAYKSDEIGVIPSSEITLEDGYLLYKFAHNVLKTRNMMRVRAQSPLELYKRIIGKNRLAGDYNFSLEAISKAKLIFIINEDIVTSYPIIWLAIFKAVKKGAKLIIASPLEFSWSRFSSLFLKLKPGSEFYLLSFIAKYFLEEVHFKSLSKLKNFDSFRKFLDKFEAPWLKELVGLREETLKETAHLLHEDSPLFIFGPGLSLSASGPQSFEALWNLTLLTGGRLIPLSLDCDQRGMMEIENHFSSSFADEQKIFTQLTDARIKAIYAVGGIPHFKRKPEFLMIQDSFLSEEASKADVILPAATFLEREGTLVNTEGRIQKLNRVINPLGEAKPDWWIISQIAQRMGRKGFNYKKTASIMKEIQQSIPALAKASYSQLAKRKNIFISSQASKGQNKFLLTDTLPLRAKLGKKYPYLLLLRYNSDHYRNLILSQEVKGLSEIRDSRWVEISPQDAQQLNLDEGETIVIQAPKGQFKGITKISEALPPGILKASFLPAQDSEYSSLSLFTSGKDKPSLGPLAVKIIRGK